MSTNRKVDIVAVKVAALEIVACLNAESAQPRRKQKPNPYIVALVNEVAALLPPPPLPRPQDLAMVDAMVAGVRAMLGAEVSESLRARLLIAVEDEWEEQQCMAEAEA